MVSAKDEMIIMYINEIMERFDGDDLRFLKEKLWMVSYKFEIREIQTTEIATTNGETTELLLEYFKAGKKGSGKSNKTIDQYRHVVHQLCDFCHKELNQITSDDVMYFMAKY